MSSKSKDKNATSKGKRIRLFSIIAILTAIVMAGASLPYIISRMGNSDDSGGSNSSSSDEMRGVWVAYLSLSGINKAGIDSIISQAKESGMNAIYFQVRPFGDALYDSEYFPWSHLLTGEQGEEPEDGFDPLAYAVEAAHLEGMELHAWVNPLRIMLDSGTTPPSLSDDNPYVVWRSDDDEENDDWVIDYGEGKYYNPAIPEVRELIINGIVEIVENYDVDGIHWDDYFYPASDESFDDSGAYSEYTAEGGELSLLDWRTQNINELVSGTYAAIKAVDSSVEFGISPSGNISNCRAAGADVELWGGSDGYVDYLCPQIYWTNDNDIAPFEATCLEWRELVSSDSVKLYVGLALYKAGSELDDGEWEKSDDIIMNQVLFIRGDDVQADGFALYSYAYLDSEQTADEMENLMTILQ